jgi:hypothetical protein
VEEYIRRKGLNVDPSQLAIGAELNAALSLINKPNAVMLRTAITDYLVEIGKAVRPSTAAIRHKRLHAFREWLGGDCELSQITKAQAGKYLTDVLIRTDNGVPFASAHSIFGLSKLSVWWLRLGIRIERIKPGHPEQNATNACT